MKRIVTTLLMLIGFLGISVGSAFATTVTATNLTLTVSPGNTTIALQGAVSDSSTASYQINGTGCGGCTAPSHGTISYFNPATGTLVYSPTGGATSDSFTFTVTANSVTSSQGTVSITVASARTTISAHLLNPDNSPRQGSVTFIPTQAAMSPNGLVPQSSAVSANLDGSGQFTVSLYASTSLNPVTYYQEWFSGTNGTRELIGLYSVPASPGTVTDSVWAANQVTDTNLMKRFVFASESAVEALASLTQPTAGSNTQIIFNNGSGYAGSNNLTWDGTTENVNGASTINPQAISSELAGSWTNSTCAGFSTFTPSGTAITTAVTGGGAGLAYQSVALTNGATYRVTFTLSSTNASLLRFGSFAFDCLGGDQLGGFSGPFATVGINSITFTSSRTATDLIGFWHNGGDASVTFSVSAFSIKQITSGTDALTAGGAITSYETITGKTLTTDHGIITNPVSFLKTELFGAAIVVAKDTPSGDTSNGAQQSVALGYGTTVKMSGATAIGANASAQNNSQADNIGFSSSPYGGYPTIIGFNAGTNSHGLGTSLGSYTETGTNESVAIGPSSIALNLAEFSLGDHAEARGVGNEIVIGDAIVATGNGVIALGGGGRFTNDSIISLGYNSQLGQTVANSGSFANQQVLIGGSADGSSFGIKDVWLGNGDVGAHHAWQNTTPFSVTIHSTEGVGTNVSGGDLGLSAGHGTGNATGSKIIFKTPVPAASGSGNQSLATGLTITVGTAQLSSYTVSGLPSASIAGAGAMAFVTDSTQTSAAGIGSTVAGSGSNKVLVISDGTNWTIH